MGKRVEIISPENARRAMQRRLPAVLRKLNTSIRNGERFFITISDYPQGMVPFVAAAFRRQPGWEVEVSRHGSIKIRLPGEPEFS